MAPTVSIAKNARNAVIAKPAIIAVKNTRQTKKRYVRSVVAVRIAVNAKLAKTAI